MTNTPRAKTQPESLRGKITGLHAVAGLIPALQLFIIFGFVAGFQLKCLSLDSNPPRPLLGAYCSRLLNPLGLRGLLTEVFI